MTVIIITMAVPSACYNKICTLLYKKKKEKTLFLLYCLCVETMRWPSFTACSFRISETFTVAHSWSLFTTSQILGTDGRKFWKAWLISLCYWK